MDSPVPTHAYSNPSKVDLAAIVTTVSVVGILMLILVTWLVFRLRRVSQQQPIPISSRRRPIHSYVVRPSFAPSEASSKFGFIRKSLRISHRHRECTSWDFADPDPFAHPKEASLDSPLPSPPSPKHRPPPLVYVPRAHRTKDELSPRTPTTPRTPITPSVEFVEPPPPAYCRETASWHPISLPSS
ncbi:hypothetical protein JVU11DRAFT_7671 [Chiua virens]|nr:hypothetical protein JVU11DRAFT_7671 [Chiua virens]